MKIKPHKHTNPPRTSGPSVFQAHVRAVEQDVVIVVVRVRVEGGGVSHTRRVILSDPRAVTQPRHEGQLEKVIVKRTPGV